MEKQDPASGPPPQYVPPDGPMPSSQYPPQGYPPQGQGQPVAAYPVAVGPTVTVVRAGGPIFTESPVNMTCPHCQTQIITKITYVIGLLTWAIVGFMFLVGLWLCCWIPCLINDTKDVVHSCPNCKREVGRRNRFQ